MKSTTEILHEYTRGEIDLTTANYALKAVGAQFHLDPEKNVIKEDEVEKFGLLDTGTGTLDKVAVENGEIADDMGNMLAFCFYNGKTYRVEGKKLV